MQYTRHFMAGGAQSFDHFRGLVQLLLGATIMRPDDYVRLASREGAQELRTLGGKQGPTAPVQLRDGRWLRVAFTLKLVPHDASTRLKVTQSSFQYQEDEAGAREVFRYDYLRHTTDEHPRAHLNVHGRLLADQVLPADKPLAKVHFPTDRVSLESIIRLLIMDFRVPTAVDMPVWRELLNTSEAEFKRIAHRP